MNSQQLADRLAELAGWYPNESRWTREVPQGWDHTPPHVHPFPVGSLDALERWRGENLPGWEFWAIYGPIPESSEWSVTIGSDPSKSGIVVGGPTEWDARAAALVAAKEQEMKK